MRVTATFHAMRIWYKDPRSLDTRLITLQLRGVARGSLKVDKNFEIKYEKKNRKKQTTRNKLD